MIIHFLNLFNYLEKNYTAQIGIKSWQKYMPEHEIKVWTENDEFIKNILNKDFKFLKYINESKNYGFLCDYLRLKIQYEFGGMYSELDQILLYNINFNGEYEFCDSLSNFNALTTEFLPCYFKKGNKILKFLIETIENNFTEDWFKEKYGETEISICWLRNIPSNLKIETLKLIENNKKMEEDFGYFALHLSDWWLKSKYINKTLFFRSENLEEKLLTKGNYVVCLSGSKKFWKESTASSRKFRFDFLPILIKHVKYLVYENPNLKNKIIDFDNILGDLDNITQDDWKIEI